MSTADIMVGRKVGVTMTRADFFEELHALKDKYPEDYAEFMKLAGVKNNEDRSDSSDEALNQALKKERLAHKQEIENLKVANKKLLAEKDAVIAEMKSCHAKRVLKFFKEEVKQTDLEDLDMENILLRKQNSTLKGRIAESSLKIDQLVKEFEIMQNISNEAFKKALEDERFTHELELDYLKIANENSLAEKDAIIAEMKAHNANSAVKFSEDQVKQADMENVDVDNLLLRQENSALNEHIAYLSIKMNQLAKEPPVIMTVLKRSNVSNDVETSQPKKAKLNAERLNHSI